MYPLHRVKVLLQTQDSNPLIINGQVPRYTVLGAAPRLLREGGLRELWRGNAAYMARHIPSTTLSFAFKDALLRAVLPPVHLKHGAGPTGVEGLGAAAATNMAAGFVGGAAALFLVYPLDFATIRMAAELRRHKRSEGVFATLNNTQRAGGVAALYRGYGVSALAIGSYKALYFGLYDTACAVMEQRAAAQHQDSPGVLERWGAANAVVVAASTATYPLDTVRKRLVADTALGPGRQAYGGVADCVAKIARSEGIRGFYRFYGYDTLLRLGGGILLVMYDEVKSHGVAGAISRLNPIG
ncbi:hypothetical protein HYH03_010854 [Edaphochlamys debaryana]|uniref:ADP/ATP translocase n=1 Tax=Edaphochlamys debaryana TaxID=47281 RepID=A0A836BX01_9CHLO|nr:hypothetical protein HYH03_010854 [Edaphochlamys debaryana]|eukprot:KAG2490693.1 hypothetical protein HYH03_010854 [Edaphochlamys debaryana]